MDEARSLPPLEIVPGLEINCDVPGAEIHVLGYCVDWEAPWFQDFLGAQREERRRASTASSPGSPSSACRSSPRRSSRSCKEGSAGRPHVAQAMVERGYVKSVREAFDRYLSLNGPANVPRRRLTPVEAVRIIRRARGVPVLAHPGLANRDELIPELVDAGLLGIETFYPEHSSGQITTYREMCARHGLVATGGSDFHGPHVGGVRHPGVQPVPDERLAGTAAPPRALAEEAPRRHPRRARRDDDDPGADLRLHGLPGHAQGAALLQGARHHRALRRLEGASGGARRAQALRREVRRRRADRSRGRALQGARPAGRPRLARAPARARADRAATAPDAARALRRPRGDRARARRVAGVGRDRDSRKGASPHDAASVHDQGGRRGARRSARSTRARALARRASGRRAGATARASRT